MHRVESNRMTFIAGAAIAPHLRVVLSSGKLAVAGLDDRELGTTDGRAYADGDAVEVYLRNAEGTNIYTAAKDIAVGAAVYSAADGKVSDTDADDSYLVGEAMSAATADGDLIEVLPQSFSVANSS